MKKTDKIMECVANISHGSNDSKLKKIIEAVRIVKGQKILDIDSSLSANRTVITFAGEPESVFHAAFELISITSAVVDMRHHKGNHPRIGATDVCPFVPIQNCSKNEAVRLSIELARKVGHDLHIPVYLYELSAKSGYRSTLPQIRRGGYEGLQKKMQNLTWKPDFGPDFISDYKDQILKTGATVIGARNILVAFNISLVTTSVATAKEIAYRLRTVGWPQNLPGKSEKAPAFKYPSLRAIGWYSNDYSCAQVSFNFLRYKKTSPLEIWEKVKSLAEEYDTTATGCEVIGLIPEECILEAGYVAARSENPQTIFTFDDLIQLGVQYFQFNNVRPFDPEQKILEYRLQEL